MDYIANNWEPLLAAAGYIIVAIVIIKNTLGFIHSVINLNNARADYYLALAEDLDLKDEGYDQHV